jgi:hypothetical protein
VAFVRVTRTISGRDNVEKLMACGLLPLSASFGICEIVEGEMPVAKLVAPTPMFPVARLLDETNDNFVARVELASVNVISRCARMEHDVCIVTVPNEGQVTRVLE